MATTALPVREHIVSKDLDPDVLAGIDVKALGRLSAVSRSLRKGCGGAWRRACLARFPRAERIAEEAARSSEKGFDYAQFFRSQRLCARHGVAQGGPVFFEVIADASLYATRVPDDILQGIVLWAGAGSR